MDVRRRFLTLVFLKILLTGCTGTKTVDTAFPATKPECEQAVIPGQYVVRWIGGSVTLEHGEDPENFRNDFVARELSQLDFVEPNFRVHIKPTDGTEFGPISPVDNWGAENANAEDAWAKGARGGGITVAVVDTGIDLQHSQLADRIAHNAGETGRDPFGRDRRFNGVDDDGNGFVDDYQGYNFFRNSPDAQDEGEHGTHVSGIIAGAHSDSEAGGRTYIQGVAPEAKILPVAFLGPEGGDLFAGMRAIDYAVKQGAQVINASWGGTICSTILRDQIAGLAKKNVVFVVSAGNSGNDLDREPEYPGAFNLPSQITVGAITPSNLRAGFSNYGSIGVHLYAPGWNIVSTVPHDSYNAMSGTSMAAPFVSGAVAILRSAHPQATVTQIRQALFASVDHEEFYQNASSGRLNIGAALEELGFMISGD